MHPTHQASPPRLPVPPVSPTSSQAPGSCGESCPGEERPPGGPGAALHTSSGHAHWTCARWRWRGGPRLGGVAASRFSQELLGSTSQDPSSAELNQELWTLRRVTGRPPPLWCGQASWEEATQGASGKKTTQKTPAQSTGSSPLPQKPFPKQNRIHTKEEILQLNFKRKREGGVATGGPRQGLGTESVDSTLVAPQGRPAMVS